MGWRLTGAGLAHNGIMLGTAGHMESRTDGFAFAIVTNWNDGVTPGLAATVPQIARDIIQQIPRWPAHDLF